MPRWDGGKGCCPGPQPDHLSPLLPAGYSTSSFLQMLHPECKELPEPNLLPGQLSHGALGVKEGRVQWISMAFESVSSQWPRLTVWPDQRGGSSERGILRPKEVKLLPPPGHIVRSVASDHRALPFPPCRLFPPAQAVCWFVASGVRSQWGWRLAEVPDAPLCRSGVPGSGPQTRALGLPQESLEARGPAIPTPHYFLSHPDCPWTPPKEGGPCASALTHAHGHTQAHLAWASAGPVAVTRLCTEPAAAARVLRPRVRSQL